MENFNLSSAVSEEKNLLEENLMGDFENNSKVGFTVEGDGLGEKRPVNFNLNSTNQKDSEDLKSIQLDLGEQIRNVNSSLNIEKAAGLVEGCLMGDFESYMKMIHDAEKTNPTKNGIPKEKTSSQNIANIRTQKPQAPVKSTTVGKHPVPKVNSKVSTDAKNTEIKKSLNGAIALPKTSTTTTATVTKPVPIKSSLNGPRLNNPVVDLKSKPLVSKDVKPIGATRATGANQPTRYNLTLYRPFDSARELRLYGSAREVRPYGSARDTRPISAKETRPIGKVQSESSNNIRPPITIATSKARPSETNMSARSVPGAPPTTKPVTESVGTKPTWNRPRLNDPVVGLKSKPLVSKDVKPIGATRATGTNQPTRYNLTFYRPFDSVGEPRPYGSARESRPIDAKETRPIGKVQPESFNNIRPPPTSKARPSGTNMSARSVPGAPPTTKPVTESVGTKPTWNRPRLNDPVVGLKSKPLFSKDGKPIGATRATGTNQPTRYNLTFYRPFDSARELRLYGSAREVRPYGSARDTRPISVKETRPIGKVQPESSNNIRPPTTTATSSARPNMSARSVPGTKPVTGSVRTKPVTARPPWAPPGKIRRPTVSKEAAPRTAIGSIRTKKIGTSKKAETNPTKKFESPSKAVNGTPKETPSRVIVETNGIDQVPHSEKTETIPVEMNRTEETIIALQTVTNNVSEEQAGVLEEEVKEIVSNKVQAI